jgi:HEAT repeat protein
VLAKVIEISGDIGNAGTLQYLTAYLNHPDERVSRIAAESIQKINTKENSIRKI